MNDQVTLIEVGPRDGLQSEAVFVDTATKIALINHLSHSGLRNIEVTSFVSAKFIPQFSDSLEVFRGIEKPENINFSTLVPNERGMQNALQVGVKNIAIFTAASEKFNLRNINCSIAESIARFIPVVALAKQHKIHVRAYISCALGCPYEGAISPALVVAVAEQLIALGVDELSLGDTIGVGTARQTKELLVELAPSVPLSMLSMHFHDTYGQAVANIYAALESGVRRFDSAVAGLGGCPYARGATGNVATEDVLYLMHGLGMETGIDIFKIVVAGDTICKALNRKNQSKVALALLANA